MDLDHPGIPVNVDDSALLSEGSEDTSHNLSRGGVGEKQTHRQGAEDQEQEISKVNTIRSLAS